MRKGPDKHKPRDYESAPGLDRRDEFLTSEDLGEPAEVAQQGQSRSVVRVESQAGRKPGWATRTAGAKREATRAAKGGLTRKHGASSLAKKKKGAKSQAVRRSAKKRAS
jgi:hypothetical protein